MASLPNVTEEGLVLMQWLWKYLTFQRGARLITRDPRETHAGFLPTSYHRQ